jgi:pyruvate dehydrogenase E2 component (dihydrolipoamide acetyltransferase)
MTDVLMPQMGESVTEGTVTRWLKRAGERVERDSPLLEISTDKVDAEIPAPATGVLSEVLVAEGTTVPVATVLARIASPEQVAQPAEDAGKREASPAPQPPPAMEPVPVANASDLTAAADTPSASELEELRRTRSSPLVRRMAADHKVDLSAVRGTGIDGRVTRHDLQDFLAQGVAPAPAAVPPPATSAPARPAAEAALAGASLSPLQRRTAELLTASHRNSAPATTVFEMDLTSIERLRIGQARAHAERGASLTALAFILKATAEALRAHPLLNASLEEQHIVSHEDVNIGVNVPLDRGLIVPVVRRVNGKSVAEIARELADLTERAHARRLNPEEVQHATFTVSDAGGLGSLFGVPIIQQPQVAVLSVGAVEKRPIVVNDAIAIRSVAFFALTFDQRLIETSDADRFMAQLKQSLAASSEATH